VVTAITASLQEAIIIMDLTLGGGEISEVWGDVLPPKKCLDKTLFRDYLGKTTGGNSLDFRLQLPTPISPDEFLVAIGASICGAKRVGRASPF